MDGWAIDGKPAGQSGGWQVEGQPSSGWQIEGEGSPTPNTGIMAHPLPGGKIALIPTRDEAGRELSDEEAQAQYWKTGNHIGIYDNPEQATKAAQAWQERAKAMPMMASHGQAKAQPQPTPYVTTGMVPQVIIPGQAGSEVAGQLTEAPQIAGAQLMRGVAGYAQALQKSPRLAAVSGLPGLVAQAAPSLVEKYAPKISGLASEFLESRQPVTGAGEVAQIAGQTAMAPLKYGMAGPAAPGIIGVEALGNTYLDAKKAGASEDEAIMAAGGSGAVQALIAAGIPFIKAQGIVSSIFKGAAVGAGMHAGAAASTAIYSPESAKQMVTSPTEWAKAVLPMIAVEAVAGGRKAPEAGKPEPTVEPTSTPSPTERTPEIIHSEAVEAAKKGDIAKLTELKRELETVQPKAEVAPEPIPEPIPEPMPKPERGPVLPVTESTTYKGERQGSLMGPNDEQLVARDPETGQDIGRLWITKTEGGFEVRKVETDPEYRGRGVATKLYREAASKYGPYEGSTERTPEGEALIASLRKANPEIFGEQPVAAGPVSEPTPGMSGLETISNEEVQRAQRGDTYYRVDRSGRVTNLGPQPDAPVRNGEAIIMVNGQTGEPQVQNSQGLGNDAAVLSRFGDKVMRTHEAAKPVLADNLGLQQMYEAGMNKAKDFLGLERTATDGDVVRAVQGRIGKLGASVKETAVRIMNQVKGIGRDLANAIAEHLHKAVSGTRESQLGAIGKEVKPKTAYTPEEEAHYNEHITRGRDLIAEFLPGDENKSARAEAYRNLPSKASVIADYRSANAPVPAAPPVAPKYNRIQGFAKTAVQPIMDAPKVARALISGDNTATNRVWKLLTDRNVLPKPYEKGSLENPKIVRPLIFGEDAPGVVKDFRENPMGKGVVPTFNRYMRSPHNLEEPVFGKYNTPTQDIQMATVSAMHNRNNLSNYFRDLLRTAEVKDNSTEMQAQAKPLFEQFQKASAVLEPLQSQREAIEARLKRAKSPEVKAQAEGDLASWDAKNGTAIADAKANMESIQKAHQAMLRDFASKYGDARVALAAEYDADKVPDWIKLSPDEKKAADGMRDTMKSIKGELDRVGIPTRDENYVTHLTKYLAPETGAAYERRTPREVLKFAERAGDSSQWLPSVHAAVADYVPNVTRKLAMQEFYNKWRSMIDSNNPDSLSNPASKNYAPNASVYLNDLFKTLDTPEAHNFFDKVVNSLRDYENMKLLSANVRVGWKHLAGKVPSILAQHDVWTVPGALGQAKALVGKLSESNPIRTAVDKLGGNTVDWAKKAELVSYFANTREILGMLRENPFSSGVEEIRKLGPAGAGSNKVMRTIFGDRAQDATAAMRRGFQRVTSNPVAAVEAWENGLDLLTSIEKGKARGLEDTANVKAFLNNILDFNFRGGADSPRLVKDPKTRYFIQFAQTPMKLAELKAKLIANAIKGGQDIYGTDHTANLVKHVITIGVALGVAKQIGVNAKDSIMHLPFLNSDQWGRMAKMAYYGSKSQLTSDPQARRKFNDAKAAFMGERMPAIMGSPVFDILSDVKTGLAAGPMGLVKEMPVYNQMKAILSGKPPRGFDSIAAYLTGERSEQSKKQMERKAIQAGRRQIKYEQKLERTR